MAYDLEEQEQLESIKAWWKKHGNWITWVLIIALGCYAAYAYWGYYQDVYKRQSYRCISLVDEKIRCKSGKMSIYCTVRTVTAHN